MTTAIDNFLADGFVAVRRAVAPGVVRTCAALVEEELRARGIDPRNRVTWTKAVVRFPCPEGHAFAAAGTSPALCTVYDQLLGRGVGLRAKASAERFRFGSRARVILATPAGTSLF